MHKQVEIKVGGKEVIVRDLTAKEVDTLIGSPSDQAQGLGVLLGSDLTAEAVAMATDRTIDELLEEFTFDELKDIWVAAEEMNDFLLKRLNIMLDKAKEAVKTPETSSAA